VFLRSTSSLLRRTLLTPTPQSVRRELARFFSGCLRFLVPERERPRGSLLNFFYQPVRMGGLVLSIHFFVRPYSGSVRERTPFKDRSRSVRFFYVVASLSKGGCSFNRASKNLECPSFFLLYLRRFSLLPTPPPWV